MDERGAPVAGARVMFEVYYKYTAAVAKQRQALSATSGADGSFSFNDLPFHPPVSMWIVLGNGHVSSAMLAKDGATLTVVDRLTTASFKVQDGRGNPITNANLVLRGPKVVAGPVGIDMRQYAAAKPASDGSVTLSGLPAGIKYAFECEAPGYLKVQQQLDLTAEKGPIVLTLAKGVTLCGRVTHNGSPVSGAYVQVLSYVLRNNGWMGEMHGGETKKDGSYTVVAPLGSYQISASHDHLVSGKITGVHAALGAELDGLDIPLVEPIKVTGQVLEEGTDQPVKGAQIEGTFGGNIVTGADGRFTVSVPPGQHQFRVPRVGAQQLGYPYPELDTTIDADHNDPIKFFVAHTALLPPIVGLDGVVADPNGHPVAGARIGIIGEEKFSTTDGEGRFKLDLSVNPGSKLYVTGAGRATSKAIEMMDQQHLSIVLDGPAVNCAGRAVDDVGNPIPDADVTLFGEKSNFIFRVGHSKTGPDGRFVLENLFPAMPSYTIWVKKEGYSRGDSFDHEVKDGQSLALGDIKMVPADAEIGGSVIDPDGKPASGVTVMATGVENVQTVTDPQGGFHLSGVPRGKDFLTVQTLGGDEFGSANGNAGRTDLVIHLERADRAASSTYQDMTGQTAASFVEGQWLNSNHVDLTSLKGKIVVLDLWAVWCGPCVRALPDVQALYDKYKSRGVVVLGVHVAGTPLEKALAFVKEKGLSYPVMMDTPKGANATAFPAKGIPQVYVIGPNGKIVCDSHDVADADEAVQKLLKQ